MRVAYFPIHDMDFPRNRLIRAYLESDGFQCVAIDRGHGRFERSTPRKRVRAVARLVREGLRSDVIVLSELSLQYAAFAWIVARLGGALLVVDGFVGLYETRVLDWGRYARGSFRARVMSALDRIAFACSDIYLTDTSLRAEEVRARYRARRAVVSLPVGAPAWATPQPPPTHQGDELKVLYYGNYAPLHGVDTILAAARSAADTRSLQLVMVGEGPLRPAMEKLAADLGLDAYSTFVDRIPESDLPRYIGEADIVLGIFGPSEKAGGVIPNKVWQGLACGRLVVTRESPALAEIGSVAGDQLRTVPPSDPAALAGELLSARTDVRFDKTISARLTAYVDGEFGAFTARLRSMVARKRRWRSRERA